MLEVEARALGERLGDVAREVDRAEAAAAVGRQRLLGAGIRRLDRLAVVQVVVAVDAVEEQDARLGVVVRRAHDLVPQLACPDLAIDPQTVGALVRLLARPRFRLVDELELLVLLDGEHEVVRDADGDVEVGEVARVFRVDEILDIGVIAAQDAHLRAAASARRFHRLARAVEDAHVGNGSACPRARAFHLGTLGADGREIVADAAAATHGLGGLEQRGVNAGPAVDHLGNRIAHRLHEAVDERRLQLHARGGVDAAGRNEAVVLRLQEAALPMGAPLFAFGLGEGACHAAAHLVDARLVALRVLLEQRVPADLLRGSGNDSGVHFPILLDNYTVSGSARRRAPGFENYPACAAGSCSSAAAAEASASASRRASFRRSATAAWPMRSASSTGVSPSRVVMPASAPSPSSTSTIAGLPFIAAYASGV